MDFEWGSNATLTKTTKRSWGHDRVWEGDITYNTLEGYTSCGERIA